MMNIWKGYTQQEREEAYRVLDPFWEPKENKHASIQRDMEWDRKCLRFAAWWIIGDFVALGLMSVLFGPATALVVFVSGFVLLLVIGMFVCGGTDST